MFESARLTLTAWYLLIILIISVFFSLSIYDGVSSDLEEGFARMEQRMRRMPAFADPGTPIPFLDRDLRRAKDQLVLKLVYANGAILILAAMASYFMAGRTLKPIEENLKEQKRFVTDASHELRTPLTALKTTTEVALRSNDLDLKEAKRVLKSNLEEVNSLKTLSDDLLSLAKYEKVDGRPAFELIDLGDLVKATARKMAPLVDGKGITLEIETEHTKVRGDRTSLEKMLLSLLDNANKYTPEGGRIRVTARPDSRNALIEIGDTGVGIPETFLPHLFDRFFRVDQSRSKRKVSGFGLGLSIVRRIVELHKGTISVRSVVGEGTTFSIRIPQSSS